MAYSTQEMTANTIDTTSVTGNGEIFFYPLPQPEESFFVEDKKLLTVIELNKQALEGKLIL